MSVWLQWSYQYSVGGLFFLATVIVALQSGAVRWHNRTERRLLLALVGAVLASMSVHAVWIASTAR